eukprot:171570-Chlamydomonas_euryale.AAC.1
MSAWLRHTANSVPANYPMSILCPTPLHTSTPPHTCMSVWLQQTANSVTSNYPMNTLRLMHLHTTTPPRTCMSAWLWQTAETAPANCPIRADASACAAAPSQLPSSSLLQRSCNASSWASCEC